MARGYDLRWLTARAFLLLVATLGASTAHAAGWVVEGRVVAISDGDTITVLDEAKMQHKVRFAGIDAPEKGQAFGTASKENLSRLIFDRRVEARCHKRDRYGREVCAVYVGMSDVGLEQIRAGMAWWYREYAYEQPAQERLAYRDEEENAKAARRGLWKDAERVPPWEYRRATPKEPYKRGLIDDRIY
jgi:endonuclease YncB( thermonuclease family)